MGCWEGRERAGCGHERLEGEGCCLEKEGEGASPCEEADEDQGGVEEDVLGQAGAHRLWGLQRFAVVHGPGEGGKGGCQG